MIGTPKLKYKHMYSEPIKERIENIRPTTATCDSNLIKGNDRYIAFSYYSTGGGVLCVLENDKPQKLPVEYPKIKGHAGIVLDLDFFPFDNRYIATSSDDTTIKIWKIPE